MAHDARIDAYIDKAAPFARPILRRLRELAHATVPGLGEAIKWGVPHFTLAGKNVAGMAAFKAHASFAVHGDSGQDGSNGDAGEDAGGKPDDQRGGTGPYIRIATLEDIPEAYLRAKLLAAQARIENAGTAVKAKAASRPAKPGSRPAKPELPMPDDFAAALSQQARAVLDGFAPSHRREYVEWITQAKRPETRSARIAQAAEWLAEGKKRNWKYEGC